MIKINEENRKSYLNITKWLVLASLSGTLSFLVVHSFLFSITAVNSFLKTFSFPIFLWTIPGALIVGGIIYRLSPKSAGEGIPRFIKSIREKNGYSSFSSVFFKYWAALITLSTFGNGGVVGPLGRVSSGLMSFVSRKLNFLFDQEDMHTASICGLAGAVGTIFHSSIGAGIFAVEVIGRKNMGYKDLFPAILSSSVAVFICKTYSFTSFYNIHVPNEFMESKMIGGILVLALLSGIIGSLYIKLYIFISKIIKRNEGNILLKVLIGSIVAGTLGWIFNSEILGTSVNFIGAIIEGDEKLLSGNLYGVFPLFYILIIMLVIKALCNCITVGSGMSAGFTGPCVIIGMLLGASLCEVFNIPIGTPTYYAFIATGFCGLLSSMMNIPLAAAIMTIEIFGLQYSLPAGITAIVAFQLSRSLDIYEFALKNTK